MIDDEKTREQLVHELTGLRSQNAALKKSESAEKYRSLVENLRDVIYELDSQGVVLYISPAIRDLLGFDSDKIVGKNFIEFAHKDDLSSQTEWFSELRKGREDPSEYRVSNKSGELRWARTKTRPIMEDGLFKGARGILIDVTDQRRVEEALRESEEKYRLSFENIADVIFTIDANLNVLTVSPSVEKILGYKPQDFIGRLASDLANIFTPESFEQAIADISLVLKGETIPATTYRFIAKDGTIKYGEVSGSPVMRDDKIIGMISVARDITDRKRAEEALRMLLVRNEAILAAVPDIIMEVDVFKRYTWANQAGMRFFGEDVIGREASYYFEGEQETYSKVQPLFDGGEDVIYIESWQRRQDGEKRLLSWWCKVLKNEQGLVIGALSTGRDITEHKQAEKQLQETIESLRKAFGATVQVMVSAVESRDPYTSGHQIRSANLARAIATEMGLPPEKIEGIRMAGSIHDIGKLSIPAEILSKPAKLSAIELMLIQEHANKGFEMLKDVESPWPLAEIVHQHHERLDGSGYPRHLKREDILMEARILAVADVVEAMASHRPYRPGLGIDAALNEIEKNRGIFYDDAVADACLRLFRERGFQLEGT